MFMKITCINHCIYKLQHILETKKLQVIPEGAPCSCMLPQYPLYNTYTKYASHISFYSTLTHCKSQFKGKSSNWYPWAIAESHKQLWKNLSSLKFLLSILWNTRGREVHNQLHSVQSLLSGHLIRFSVLPTTLHREQLPLLKLHQGS